MQETLVAPGLLGARREQFVSLLRSPRNSDRSALVAGPPDDARLCGGSRRSHEGVREGVA
jgi:hypothetical protein